MGGVLLASSATSNHVHLLAHTPTDISIADLVCSIKSCSSKWYRENDIRSFNQTSNFGWNEGYSAFTVSPSSIETVKQYFGSEKSRHSVKSFEEELLDFLKLQEIEFEKKYMTTKTFTKLIYHLVWSVKNREPLLDNSLQALLHQSIRDIVEKNNCKLLAVGNVEDHIHLLVEYTSRTTTAKLVQSLKTTTSLVIKANGKRYSNFHWQEGFGIFSVGKPALHTVSNYVNNQEQHHRTKSFDDEWDWLRGVKRSMNGVSLLRSSVL